MAGFLRRKLSPGKKSHPDAAVPPGKQSTSSTEPPSLPPLFHGRTSKSSSSHRGPESEAIAASGPSPSSSSSQHGASKENNPVGPSTSPVSLPDIPPIHSTLDADDDWKALIQFIDAPESLLADPNALKSSKADTPPPEKQKNPSTGVGLVVSNRYLSQAQKNRMMVQARGFQLNDTRSVSHEDEPLARLVLLSSTGAVPGKENVTPGKSGATPASTTPGVAASVSKDRRHESAGGAQPVKEERESRVRPGPGEDRLAGQIHGGTQKETTHPEGASSSAVYHRRREGENIPAVSSAKNAKPAQQDAKTPAMATAAGRDVAANRPVTPKVSELRDGRPRSSRGGVRALLASVVPGGRSGVDMSNGKPAVDVSNSKTAADGSPNMKSAGDASTPNSNLNPKPRVDVVEWQAAVKKAKDSESARRAARTSAVVERSRSPPPASRPTSSPNPISATRPASAGLHASSQAATRSRSPAPNPANHPLHRPSNANLNMAAMPDTMFGNGNEKMSSQTRGDRSGRTRMMSGNGTSTTGTKTATNANTNTNTNTNTNASGKLPPTSYPEQRVSTAAGYPEQRAKYPDQQQQRISQGQPALSSTNGYTHRRSASSDLSYAQGQNASDARRSSSPIIDAKSSGGAHGHTNGHWNGNANGSTTHQHSSTTAPGGPRSSSSGYFLPSAVSQPPIYPAPGTFTPTIYPSSLPTPATSFCPTAFPATAAFNPYAFGPGAMTASLYNPYQTFAMGLSYPSPAPSPTPYAQAQAGSTDPNATTPRLYRSPSATSFFDSVMQGVGAVSGAGHAPYSHLYQQQGAQFAQMRKPRSVSSDSAKEKDKPKVLTKTRPTPPPTPPHASSGAQGHGHSKSRTRRTKDERQDDRVRKECALLDSDPFAKVEGVRVVMARHDSRSSSREGGGGSGGSTSGHGHGYGETPARPSYLPTSGSDLRSTSATQNPSPKAKKAHTSSKVLQTQGHQQEEKQEQEPEDYHSSRQERRGKHLEKTPPPLVAETVAQRRIMRDSALLDDGNQQGVSAEAEEESPKEEPKYFPLPSFLCRAEFLAALLEYLEFRDWLALYAVNRRSVRSLFDSSALPSVGSFSVTAGDKAGTKSNARQLREVVLEKFLRPVGYTRWEYEWAEPIVLSLRDLNNYMRGISMPSHDYARLARAYLSQPKGTTHGVDDVMSLALTTRAYTKVVLRLRAQAESEARWITRLREAHGQTCDGCCQQGGRAAGGDVLRRASSPTSSSHHHGQSHGQPSQNNAHARPGSSSAGSHTSSSASPTSLCACPVPRSKFRSPLLRPNRSVLLRVFVPSPDGTWLSDSSVEECEAELRRSGTGVTKLLRVGDVVWDVALGDEGNIGRMVWDGRYLVDLDYKYSRLGELSPYFHSLAFPPSYFYRVIRLGASSGDNAQANPIAYIDVSPWGKEIAQNLQLLQERGKAETPHGVMHDVVRWVHRSSFKIRPPANSSHNDHAYAHLYGSYPHLIPHGQRLPVPNVTGFFVDPHWYGTVIVEAEGTNEGLADLQERCGPGVFPPRAEAISRKVRGAKEGTEAKRVWRVVREKSRPGEIWLRAVREKERVMW
ncbi:hypothetical protein ID866_6229 [Astraeus odoratus]|nr:hypothetical protein ID866_6229 [Astraeus odoratus]